MILMMISRSLSGHCQEVPTAKNSTLAIGRIQERQKD